MRRIVLATIVGLLTLSASGASTLIAGEPCTAYELTGEGEDAGGCPPICVTCGCCAQAAEAAAFAASSSPEAPLSDLAAGLPALPNADPRDILHVPRPRLA